MVITMETGMKFEAEFGAFEEEVLYAQWQPPLPQPQAELRLQVLRVSAAPAPVRDVDAFLRMVYLAQE